jgi:hypothetical protein
MAPTLQMSALGQVVGAPGMKGLPVGATPAVTNDRIGGGGVSNSTQHALRQQQQPLHIMNATQTTWDMQQRHTVAVLAARCSMQMRPAAAK